MTFHSSIFDTEGGHDFTVPAGITSVNVTVAGSRGQAIAVDTLEVTPGETLHFVVGGSRGDDGAGGSNGGGAGTAGVNDTLGGDTDVAWNTGGSGATDLRRGGTGDDDRVLVGGGGAGSSVILTTIDDGVLVQIRSASTTFTLATSMPSVSDPNRAALGTWDHPGNSGTETDGGDGLDDGLGGPGSDVVHSGAGGGGFGGGAGGGTSSSDTGLARFGTCYSAYDGAYEIVAGVGVDGAGRATVTWETPDFGWLIGAVGF